MTQQLSKDFHTQKLFKLNCLNGRQSQVDVSGTKIRSYHTGLTGCKGYGMRQLAAEKDESMAAVIPFKIKLSQPNILRDILVRSDLKHFLPLKS